MRDLITSLITIIIAIIFAWAGSQGTPDLFGFPGLIFLTALGFIIHWVIFIPSAIFKTEKFYDITGTLAYLIMIFVCVTSTQTLFFRSKVVALLIFIWALRLGVFLFIRVLNKGEDSRFNEAKNSFSKLFMWFTISGLWVFLTTANAFTLVLNNVDLKGDAYFIIGLLMWIIGFLFEVVSDEQKRRFRKLKDNQDKFITTGLWSISRHPNYFGEILLWIGMAIISFPVLTGWQYATLISPIFIVVLLTNMSGINLLEASADKKWGDLEEYQNYKSRTPVLIPFIK